MKILTQTLSFLLFVAVFLTACQFDSHQTVENSTLLSKNERGTAKPAPFFAERAYPNKAPNQQAHINALMQAEDARKRAAQTSDLKWTFAGPTNIGGRITDVVMPANDLNTIFAAAATGGVFKSTNQGKSWQPIFDDQLSLSIGALTIAPSDAATLYVGTGEPNGGGGSITYDGIGVFKSQNGGETWQYMGLEKSRNIGRIAVNPKDKNRLFVAAMGGLFANNPERGLFRSENGGKEWEKVLYVSDSTGCVDVVIHPTQPDTLFAAMWERTRRPDHRQYGGKTSGLYRSLDGGDSWQQLTNGLPRYDVGRIGVQISASNPSIAYAIYASEDGDFKGVFRTDNHGDSWRQVNDKDLVEMYITYGWWFGNIRIDPNNPDIVYALGLDIWKSVDGGETWLNTSAEQGVHVDQHGLVIHPQNSQFLVSGNDGGVHTSMDGGETWQHLQNLPITQFYSCAIDPKNPDKLYGGSQDNGVIRTGFAAPNKWEQILSGDGFQVLVDHENSDYIYAGHQYGNWYRAVDGGDTFVPCMEGIDPFDRKNWNTPIVQDLEDVRILYFGANRLYKSYDRGLSWKPMSSDMTDGPSTGNLMYGTITTIAVAASQTEVLYVGTDDGNVWNTQDGGKTWAFLSQSLPKRWVSAIAVNHKNPNIAYLTFSGYRQADYTPHIFRTEDGGKTWIDISSNIPEAPINAVVIDPKDEQTLYVASDLGVFVTHNLGQSWGMLGSNLPNVPVMDLDLHEKTGKLVAATYGRGIYFLMVGEKEK
ncbi:MAG: hypothetical protein R3E32_15385 [Chitinophagales bacterium]